MAGFHVRLVCSWEGAVRHLCQVLEGRGFRVAQGFDLRSALAALPEECPCPHHGTARCTCNYTLLMVYGPEPTGQLTLLPQRIVVHSHHDQTWLTLLSDRGVGGERDDPRAVAQEARLTHGLVAALSEIAA